VDDTAAAMRIKVGSGGRRVEDWRLTNVHAMGFGLSRDDTRTLNDTPTLKDTRVRRHKGTESKDNVRQLGRETVSRRLAEFLLNASSEK